MSGLKVWTTLITNMNYLPGLLTLDFSLKKVETKYELLALITDTFPSEGKAAIARRGIATMVVNRLQPSDSDIYLQYQRFHDCWTKLVQFSLTRYERVVHLDSDMLVLKNMDELMDLDLDHPTTNGNGKRVFAASHACICNPAKVPQYPASWIPANCVYTAHHIHPEKAQTTGSTSLEGLGCLNSGLIVCNPSDAVYQRITDALLDSDSTKTYSFADQSLLDDCFRGQWVGLPYIYNALKTLRWQGVHDTIWSDDKVKNVHFILAPKPWEESAQEPSDETHRWWHTVNNDRKRIDLMEGITDGF